MKKPITISQKFHDKPLKVRRKDNVRALGRIKVEIETEDKKLDFTGDILDVKGDRQFCVPETLGYEILVLLESKLKEKYYD